MDEVESGDEPLDVLPIDDGARGRRPSAPSPARRRPSRTLIVGLAVTVLGVIGANIVLSGDDEESASPAEPIAPEVDETIDLIDPVSAGLGDIPFGYNDLLEGQYLRHAPTGLPGSVETVTVLCRVDTPQEAIPPLDECDSGTAQRGTTSPAGTLEIGFQVYRTINTGRAGALDCAIGECEIRTYSDRVAGIASRTPVGFELTLPPAISGPRFTVEVDTQLQDGGSFIVEGVDFPAETSIHIRPCRMGIDPDPFACDWVLEDRVIETEADGTFRFEGVADWRIGFGADGISCADITEGVCAMNVSIPGSPRQPAAVPLEFHDFGPVFARFDLPDEIEAEPAAALADGQSVTVFADGVPYDGEYGLFQCIVDSPGDCTWVDFFGEVTDGVYELPRSFVTWRGTRHDCAVDGDCMLSIFVFAQSVERVDVPIEFDPELSLRPALPMTAAPTTDLVDRDLVTVEFEEAVSLPFVAICAQDSARLCQAIGVSADQGTRIRFQVRSELVTPIGTHDCLRDGPCELMVWNGAGLDRFEPIRLDFRSESTVDLALAARPATGLLHGQTVQLAVSGIADDFSTIQICAQGTLDCAFATSVSVRDDKALTELQVSRTVQLYRQFTAELEVVDCGEVVCEFRLSDQQHIANAPLVFADAAPPPPPRIALEARYADAPLPWGEPIGVRGRDFLNLPDGGLHIFSLCPIEWEFEASCVPVGDLLSWDVASDGSFETQIVLDRELFEFQAIEALQPCVDDCELVVSNGYGEPARLPVTRRDG